MENKVQKNYIPIAMILVLAGCGAGTGEGLNNQGLPLATSSKPSSTSNNSSSNNISSKNTSSNNTSSNSSSSSSATTATLAQLQQNIFGVICIVCHVGSNAPRGLRLDTEDNTFAFLVNKTSNEIPSLMRVNPGKPDESYIIHKLEGRSTIVGSRMPLSGPPFLTVEQINSIRDWIANGAPRTGTGTATTKINPVIFEKTDNSFAAQFHFSRPVDLATLSDDAVNVSYANGNSALITATRVNLLLDDQTLTVNLQGLSPNVQKININIDQSTVNALLDTEGNEIDGDNNELPGGSYHYEY
jgi:hypothetical protein